MTDNAVSPNNKNTLASPFRRLALGSAAQVPLGLNLAWTLWIPTSFGGRLSLKLSVSEYLCLASKEGVLAKSDQGSIEYDVPKGVFGELMVMCNNMGGGSATLTATFTQTGWARQGSSLKDDPLIPNNFWYWPYGSTTGVNLAVEIMKRYARLVGKSEKAAEDDERNRHFKPNAEGWEGHCQNAAPASVLFKPIPPGPKKLKKGFFSSTEAEFQGHELKLLAAEYFGNFGSVTGVWSLFDGDTIDKTPVLTLILPGERPDRAAILRNLAGGGAVSAVARRELDDLAVKHKGDDGLVRYLTQALGAKAGSFFHTLQAQIIGQGNALVGDTRDSAPNKPYNSVWNQAIFYFRATYVETPGENDKFDMTIDCTVYANVDKENAHGPPATINNKTVEPSQQSLLFKHVYRLVFGANGAVAAGSDKNEWRSCTDGAQGKLFVPRNLAIVNKPSSKPAPRSPAPRVGNEVVGEELLDFLELNERYR